MHKSLCTFPDFLKYPLRFLSAWPMFSSLSLPDDSLTINTAPPIIICSYDTHSIPSRWWQGFQAWHAFTSALWLFCGICQAVLWYFGSAVKITFSRTVRMHFSCTWHEYRDTHVPEIGLCILHWSPFEVAHSAFPEILNICCLQSSFLWVGDLCYCSTDVGNPCLSCLSSHSVSTIFLVNHLHSSYLVIQIPLVPW